MSAPSTVNEAAKTVDQIISDTIFDVAVPAAEAAIIAEVPFLGLPLTKPFLDLIVKYFAGILYDQLGMAGVKLVITIQTDAEKAKYAAAEGALRAAQLLRDPARIQKATEDFKNAFQSLVHFDGSVSH